MYAATIRYCQLTLNLLLNTHFTKNYYIVLGFIMFTGSFSLLIKKRFWLVVSFFVFTLSLLNPLVARIPDTHKLEAWSALGSIPVEMWANYMDYTDNARRAALLHMGADIINIANKALYFYNNFKAQKSEGALTYNRDIVVTGAWGARDVSLLFTHIKDFLSAPEMEPFSDVVDELEVVMDEAEAYDEPFLVVEASDFNNSTAQVSDVHDDASSDDLGLIKKPLYVLALPTLKGLTAYAMAIAQDPNNQYFHKYARYMTAAAHSLSRFIDEYAHLHADSKLKPALGLVILMNIGWLAYEMKTYQTNLQEMRDEIAINQRINQLVALPINPLPTQDGECAVCFDDAQLIRLGCGHAQMCQVCLRGHLEQALNDNDLARARCSRAGCNHVIPLADIRTILGDDHALLRRLALVLRPVAAVDVPYCRQCYLQHAPAQPCAERRLMALPEELAMADAFRAIGARFCPGPNCGIPIERVAGCNWIPCARCRHEFCWLCLQPCFGHRMVYDARGVARHPCGCPVFGDRA